MRGIRWLAVVVVLLAALLLAGAWLLPGVLDWNRYRDDIASLASESLGRSVRIDGPVALTLLPQPTLTAAGVTVEASGGGMGITAKQLLLRVALGPLLSGHVDARELVLRGVDMHLPWPLQPDALALQTPIWLSALSARIEDGRLTVGNVVFTGVAGTLSTLADTGTTMAAGTAMLSGRRWRFTARVTRQGDDGSAGLNLTLDGLDKVRGIGASLTGQIASDGTLAGRIAASGLDLSQLLPAPAVAFKAEGRINVAAGLATANDLTVELGGSPARGSVALRITPTPRLDVTLAASRLDLDAWLKSLLQGAAGGAVSEVPIGLDLSAEAAQLGGGTLRGLHGVFDLANGVVELRDLRVSLPGGAALRASGRITLPDPHATPSRPGGFDGQMAMKAPALPLTLAWLEAAGLSLPPPLPTDALRQADLAGHVVIDPGQIAVDKLTGNINASAVSGSLTLRLGPRPRLGVGLNVDRLNLDPVLPDGLPGLAGIPALFAGFDADLRLAAKQVTLRGVSMAPLSLDGTIEGGQLTLRQLDGMIDGMHATLSGTLDKDGRIGAGQLDLQAAQTMPLAALLPERLAFLAQRAPDLWHAPITLQLLASGAPDALALKLTADIADLRLEAQPTLNLPARTWTSTITLRHPGASRLAEMFGIADARAWLGDGSLSLVAQLTGDDTRIAADSFNITAGTVHTTGALALQQTPDGPSLTGQVTAETLALPLPAMRSTDPLPLGALAGWQATVNLQAGHLLLGQWPALEQAAATLTLSDGMFDIEGLSAKLGGGTLTATLSLDAREKPPVATVQAQIMGAVLNGPLFDLPFDLTAGTLDASASFTALGYAPAALLATLGGDLHLTVLGGTLAGVDLPRAGGDLANAAVGAALAGGSTPFDRLDVAARLQRGDLQLGQAQLNAASGSILFSGGIDLPTAVVDARLGLHPAVPDAPEIGLRLSGPLGAPLRIPELAEVARWRAAHASHR
jgi:uncharacterized protein involved in outer membrane biogenesis